MALQTSGAISLNDMHIEVGGSSGTTVSLNDADIRGLIGKGSGAQSSFNEFYGASSTVMTFVPTGGGTTINWNGASTLTLNSSVEYTVTVSSNTTATVKMWGAGGALGFAYTETISSTNRQGAGGGGGYSTGSITFQAGTTYIFQIGEGGSRVSTADSNRATWRAGGIKAVAVGGYGGTQGGGYSGIFRTSTVNQSNALLIAGGGGGGSDTNFASHAGAGGGSSGQNANGSAQSGNGGSQSSGGSPSQYNSATAGSALTGGWAGNVSQNHSWLGGGGGGYYGGGGGNVGGGGGGSGYYNTSYVSSGSTTTGSASTPANSSDGNRGGAGQGGSTGSSQTGADGAIVLIP